MERLLREKKYLEAYFDSATPLQTHQHLLPWQSREVDSDFSANRFHSTNGKAYSQV